MGLINGLAPQVDQDGILRNLIWSPKFVSKVAAYTCKANETGTWFLTTGATAAVTFTLPPISDGPFIFFFVAVADIGMTVAAGTADTLLTFNDAAADSVAFSTSSEIMGGFVIAGCDGTTVFALTPISAHSQTVTVATN
ncbi:MAG TPA: hypothetical protein VIV60_00145 [Polyangiaceae bacterium]